MTRHQFTKAALRIDTGIGDAEPEDSGGAAFHPSAHGHPLRCANLFRVAVRRYARVAEWQTRTVQVRVSERTWRFNSSLAHRKVPLTRAKTESRILSRVPFRSDQNLLTRTFADGMGGRWPDEPTRGRFCPTEMAR